MSLRIPIACLLLVAGASTAAAQGASTAELYGAFRYSYNRADDGTDSRWTGANNASRLGVRGSVSERGLTAFADLQVGVNVDAESAGGAFTQRYAIAGLRGGFGAVTAGRQTTAYKAAGVRVDPFFDTSAIRSSGAVPSTGLFAAATFGLSNLTNGYADRTLAYTSPTVLGLIAIAEAHLDPARDPDYGLGLGYRAPGLDAGVQYYVPGGGGPWVQASGIESAVRLSAGYARQRAWSLGASFERLAADSTGAHQGFLYTSGTVAVAPRTTLALSVGHVGDSRAVQPVTGTGFQAGVFYAPLAPVQLHALYSRLDADAAPARSNFAVGFVYQLLLQR
jgi:hypothetical protein